MLTISAFSQLNPSSEWFTLENFFNTELIHKKDIKKIEIFKNEKKDAAVFSQEVLTGKYLFDPKGRLVESQKYVQLSRRVDTSIYEFTYKGEKLIQRMEKQGMFNFSYNYSWLSDTVILEVKRDENTLDTNYNHRTEVVNQPDRSVKYIFYNSIGRPMKKVRIDKDLFNQIVYRRESYARSISFLVDSFNYRATQLQSWLRWNTIGSQSKVLKEFTYVDGMLDFITVKKDGQLITKYALLYNENKLISSIVMRDVSEKTIHVYRFVYTYFSQ